MSHLLFATTAAVSDAAAQITQATQNLPIPNVDPLGYPLPPILLQILAYFTLTLHFLAMNFTVGAGLLLIWSRLTNRDDEHGIRRFLRGGLPLGVSYLITFGIPPLLFLQVLYGQAFYTSSNLIGFHWILIVPILILVYAFFYYQKLSRKPESPATGVLLVLAMLGLLTVGFFYVNNITLAMSPEKWAGMYRMSPGGHNLNLTEPTLFPRWLLFISPGLCVAGLALLWRGTVLLRWGMVNQGQASHRWAIAAFLGGLALELASAGWMLAVMGNEARSFITGGLPFVLLAAGVGLAALAAVVTVLARNKTCYLWPTVASLLVFLALTPLVILRDLARQDTIKSWFTLDSVPVNLQWGMFGAFVAFLLIGLALVLVLLVMVVPRIMEARRAELEAQSASPTISAE